MIRYPQNDAEAARSLTWQRRSRRQGTATRAGLPAIVGASSAGSNPTGSPGPATARADAITSRPNAPIVLKLVERIPSGSDPLRDLAIVNILSGMGGRPSAPMTVMLVGDLAERIADGSIRLHHGDLPYRRRTRGWEAPLHFGEMRRILIDRIRSSGKAGGISADDLVCTMARVLLVPNNDSANTRFIDAVWTPGHDVALGNRPSARTLTRMRAAFRRRKTAKVIKPQNTAGGTAA